MAIGCGGIWCAIRNLAMRCLDLDDVGAIVGQDHGSAGACNEARQVHNLQSRKDIVICHWGLLTLVVV
jgi:hypothetical protein